MQALVVDALASLAGIAFERSGNNECTAGSTYCNSAGTSAYVATAGYDEASGLGSPIPVDGSSQGSSSTLSGGIATYSFSSSTSGNHVIQATYSGDSTYAGSTGSIVLNVGGSSASGRIISRSREAN